MFNFCFIHNSENNILMGEMLGYSIKQIYPDHKIIAVIGKNQKIIRSNIVNKTSIKGRGVAKSQNVTGASKGQQYEGG